MSEEKLTVAELLARAGREAEPTDGRRRRRRRSLEEGGISVADLTGKHRRVEAEGPHRAAHAAPEPEAEQPAPAAPAPEAAAPEPAPADEPAAPAEQAEPEPAAEPAPAVPAEPAEPAPEPEPEPAAEAAPAEPPAAAAPAAPAAPAAGERTPDIGVPEAIPVAPEPVLAAPGGEEITFTFTALHDADTASTPVAEPGPLAREALGEAPAAADGAPAAPVEPAVPSFAAHRPAAPAAPEAPEVPEEPEPATPADARTDVQPVIRDDADQPPARPEAPEAPEAEEVPEARAFAGGSAPIGRAAAEAPVREDRPDPDAGVAAALTPSVEVDGEGDAPAAPATSRKARKADRGEPVELEDNSLSIALLIVQVIVGLIAGAFLFLVFSFLWTAMPPIAVALIAVAVVIGMVALANALRRRRDRFTPVLAGIVGLALTFGPYVLTLL